MSKTNKTEHNKKAMLKALEASLGVVTQACKIAGISRTQFYQWMHDDPLFESAVNEVAEIAVDFAESKLHKQIEDGNTTATIFYLKTKGKHRGYVEHSTTTHEVQPVLEWRE
jgi:hypothetical protein